MPLFTMIPDEDQALVLSSKLLCLPTIKDLNPLLP